MESLFGGYTTPAEQVPEVKPGSILKQGYLDKQSRYLKSWRK